MTVGPFAAEQLARLLPSRTERVRSLASLLSMRRIAMHRSSESEPIALSGVVSDGPQEARAQAVLDPAAAKVSCSCRECTLAEPCDHVFALLYVLVHSPERVWMVVPPPRERRPLSDWFSLHLSEDVARMSILEVAQKTDPSRVAQFRRVSELGLLDAAVSSESWLSYFARERLVRLAVEEHAHRWWEEHHGAWRALRAEEVLRPLQKACLVELEDVGDPCRGRFDEVKVQFQARGEELVVHRDWDRWTVPLRGSRPLASLSGRARAMVSATVLDGMLGTHGDVGLRKQVVAALERPQWALLLERLTAVKIKEPLTERVGVKLTAAEGVVTAGEVCWLSPYAKKEGFKRVRGVRSDEEAFLSGGLAVAKRLSKGPVGLMLQSLVGSAFVVDAAGLPLHVERATPELRITADGDHLQIEFLVEGKALLAEALSWAGARRGSLGVVRGSRVLVIDFPEALSVFVGVLDRFGAEHPKEASAGLLRAVEELGIDVQLEGDLRGDELVAESEPVVRLTPLGDGALQVDVRVVPLRGGPSFVPGRGRSQVAVSGSGRRKFVQRDLAHEPEQVRAALADVPLPELIDGTGVVASADDALDLIAALQEGEGWRVEWPKRRPKVLGEAGLSGVRIQSSSKRDWFGIGGEVQIEGGSVALGPLLEALRLGRRYVAVSDQGWVALSDELREALEPAAVRLGDEEELAPIAALGLLRGLSESEATVEFAPGLLDLRERLEAASSLVVELPEVQATLRPYQEEGMRWLLRMASWAPGAVLADDMGLGKTLQSLGLLLQRAELGPALIVTPASVNLNWLREAAKFTPSLSVQLYRGKGRQERVKEAKPGELWVTSYELMARDVEELAAVGFATAVYDEAQALKNASTLRGRAARALEAGFVLAISGTPVENRASELWSLMAVVVPGLLGSEGSFRRRFAVPVMNGDAAARRALAALVRPFVLRRTKQSVARDLPDREEAVVWVELSPSEREAYEVVRRQAALPGEGAMQLLAALTRLRQLACATALVDPDANPVSSKLARLTEMVDGVVENGECALVFSQFTGLLDLAGRALSGHRVIRLDGSTPIEVRQQRVDAFQQGQADVFLISLKAGGTGLTLTRANYVFHLDPWWNPAAEDQATDRAHRIGQKKTVHVRRLVSVGTVEEEVLAMHSSKRELANALLEGTATTAKLDVSQLLALVQGA